MNSLRYWTCDGCEEVLQGIKDVDGDFISDKELGSGAASRLLAVGCYLCGCPGGVFGEEVEEP